MNYNMLKNLLILFIFIIVSTGYTSAQEEYSDEFNSLDSSKWTEISGSWQIVNGKMSGTGGGFSELIFDKWEGTKYIIEFDFTANDTRIVDYVQIGFNFYYEDSDTFAQVYLKDDNRHKGEDAIKVRHKGDFIFINTQTYINTSTNTSIEFDPNVFHHLKVVRLNKNIYVYFDNNLALTTEFKDENPSGKVGFDVYESTGYFDNFYLRPISMKNASGYINELNLTSANPTTRLGPYTLRLEDIESGSAFFSLGKFGKTVDTIAASEGSRASMKFENGEEGLEFRLTKAFNSSTGSRVELEEVIYAGSESITPEITGLTLLPAYYQEESMTAGFSITNPGSIRYTGTPLITISTQGSTETMSPELDLAPGQSKDLTAALKAAKTPGAQKLTVTLRLDEYTQASKSLDYQVRALNPVVTTLSPDLREEGGIRGTVTINSAYPDELVGWDTAANIEVFRILENGKLRVYSKEMPVKSKSSGIVIPYDEFYSDDGRYLVTIAVGEMKSDKFFEIKGPDGIYNPPPDELIPPTVVSNALYPQVMLLLIGMVAALSVRNHTRPETWSLPLDIVVVGCGVFVFAAGMIQGMTEIITRGMIIAGVGFMLLMAREHNPKVDSLFMRGSPIHDFIGLVLIFFSASYIMLLIPEWNLILIVGTLIVYYTVINLHGERTKE